MKWHVFPKGPMCSIRRALMLWLLPLFLVVGITSASVSYWTYLRMVSAFMDNQMEQLAQSMVANEYLPPAVQDTERVHKWGVYVTQVFAADGRLIATSCPQVMVPRLDTPGFVDARHDGRLWRVFNVPPAHEGGTTVQIPMVARDIAGRDFALLGK